MTNAEKIRIIVYVNFSFLTLTLIYVIYSTVLEHRNLPGIGHPSYEEGNYEFRNRSIIAAVFWTVAVLLTLLFNIILLKGVNQRNRKKCLIWFIAYSIGTIIQLYKIVMLFVIGNYGTALYLLLWACISLYALFVVNRFMKEIRSDSTLQPLTNKD